MMLTRSSTVSERCVAGVVVVAVVLRVVAVGSGAELCLELPQPVASSAAAMRAAGVARRMPAFILGSPKIVKPVAPSVVDLFLELAAIPSPSGKERPVADRVGTYLTELGLAWDEDASGEAVGSDAGNIYCRLPGRDETGTPVFLCAHLATVPRSEEHTSELQSRLHLVC